MSEALRKMGEFFKAHRLEAQLEPEQVVADLGLTSLTELFEYEEGVRQIPLDDIFSMANLYNISPDIVVRFLYDLSIANVPSTEAKAN